MSDIWKLYLILGLIPGLIVFAAAYKYFEVRRASRWPSTPGRIVVSTTEAREVSRGDASTGDTETRNFPKIEYQYTIAGQVHRGHRVSIGEDVGDTEIAETLARYPVGRAVTVYYNSNNRDQAVLERDVPAGLWKGVIIVLLVIAGLIVGGVFGFGKLADVMAKVVVNPDRAPFVTACLGFAGFAALIIYAIQKTAAIQRHWPTVPGKVENAWVRSFQSRDSDGGRWRTMYRAEINFSYEVAGIQYKSDNVGAGQVSASSEAPAKRVVAHYAPGGMVDVHYDPANPAQAILNPGSRALLVLWLVPLAMAGLAFFAGRSL
jgi:hypothetical protein